MLTGENGILKQATNAKDTTDKSEFEEQVKLAVMASKVNDKGAIDLTTLEAEIGKIKGTEITKNGTENDLPWTVKKGSYEVTITEDGNTSNIEKDNDDDVMENAKKAMPTGGTIDKNTNAKTGIVMIDSNQNEWVWIEVPATVFASATSSTDYDNIKADLIAYASDYRSSSSYTDTWYNGCGLEQEEYITKYQIMLSSI